MEKCLAFHSICKTVPALQHIPMYVQTTKYSSPVAGSVYCFIWSCYWCYINMWPSFVNLHSPGCNILCNIACSFYSFITLTTSTDSAVRLAHLSGYQVCFKVNGQSHDFPFNSSPPSAAYMRQWTVSILVQVMACRLFGAKPLPQPILAFLSIGPLGTNFS